MMWYLKITCKYQINDVNSSWSVVIQSSFDSLFWEWNFYQLKCCDSHFLFYFIVALYGFCLPFSIYVLVSLCDFYLLKY